MKSSDVRNYGSFLRVAVMAALLSLLLACGAAEEPTAAPPTATAPAAATATATAVPTATPTLAPGVTPVATPRPSSTPTPTPIPAEKPQYGGTLQDMHSSYTNTFDQQLLAASPTYFYALGKLYNNLLINYEGQPQECDICSDWHLENNNKTMVFNLIPGIKFHTGEELTSEDVKYSLEMVMGQVDGIVSPRSGILKEYVESIDATSKYVVSINLLRPSLFVPKVLTVGSTVIWKAGTTRDDLANAPAGTGPFLFSERIPGASFEVERNPGYFKEGQPYIDRYEISVVPDSTTRAAAFLTHKTEFHIWPTRPPEQFLPQYYKLRDEGKVNSFEFTHGTNIRGVWMNMTQAPFADNLKLRQAVNLVLDRRAYGSVVHTGNYLPQVLVLMETDGDYGIPESEYWNVMPGWGEGAKKQQEIEEAKQLVIDAGYPDGLDLSQMARGSATAGASAVLIQSELKKIGIRTTFDMVRFGDVWQKRISDVDFTIYEYIFRQTTNTPDEAIGQAWITGAGRSPHGYSNPVVDKLFIQMTSELDPVKKVALFKEIEDIVIFKEVVYGAEPGNISEAFWWKRLRGVQIGMAMHVAGNSGAIRADRWWLAD